MADFNLGLFPVDLGAGCSAWRLRHSDLFAIGQGDGGGLDVGGDNLLAVGSDVDHVDAVLAGAEDQVDLAGGWVVAADGLGDLAGEVGLALGDGEAVRASDGAEVDRRESLAVDQVDDGEGVELSKAVV